MSLSISVDGRSVSFVSFRCASQYQISDSATLYVWQGKTGSVYYSMYNIVCMQGASPIYIPSTSLVGVSCGVCEIQSYAIK